MPPKSRKPVRKRFVKKKRTTLSPNVNTDPPDSLLEEPSALVSFSDSPSTSNSNLGCQSRTFESDHDYVTASPSSSEADVIVEDGAQEKPPESVLPSVSVDLLMDIKGKLDWFLHQNWISIVQQDSITVVFVCPGKNILIQRSLVFESNGNVDVFVHGEKLDVNPFMEGLDVFEPLEEKNVNQFVDRMVTVINNLRSMQICSGYDDEKFKSVWSQCSQGFVDKNPFREYRYEETFRSPSCLRLVHHRKWRCTECSKLYKPLKRKSLSAAVDRPKLHTANKYLTEEQMLTKLADQANTINTANRKISHMTERMQLMLTKSGVNLDNDLSDNLTELLESGQMTEAQSVFLQQQVKASQKKNMVGMRWHPTMIRFALAIHLTSPAAYELMRDTGMLKLPSSRTLFDYSHVKPVQEGIDQYVLDSLGERVSKFKKRHQKYHVLMADEMHISQNLVFQKHTGKMIGYTSLDTIDSEVKVFEEYLENPEKEIQPRIASKVLVYMIKGVTNGVKEVVATYSVASPSVCQMYDWTWKVIRALESSGVWVIAMVCDGFSTNRAFIRMHTPVSPNENNIVFDTVNKAARHRNLYFIADVPHLLKTVRNCFLNSRWDKLKSRRRMVKNNKKISWDFIVKLYNSKKHKSLRKAFKLSPMNVFPDSYSRMKVKYAAEVLSRTVAQALEDEKWVDAAETIKFIRLVNDWFDCLNGAHSAVGKKKRNDRLNPYKREDDPRFKQLEEFLEYLEEWKRETESINITGNSVANSVNNNGELDESEIDDGGLIDEPETPRSKRILSKQTLEGIEMTTRAFPLMIKFLLREGADFINARVFTQDPLEQHFSKVRAGQGGSSNPNSYQVLARNRTIHTIGQLGMKRRRGNAGEMGDTIEVTNEPLPKRKCSYGPKFVL